MSHENLNRRQFLTSFTKPLSSQSELSQTFPVQSQSSTPLLDLENWQLGFSGMLAEPRRFAWSDLRQYPTVETMRTLECIGNPTGGKMIGNARWKGFRFIDIAQDLHIHDSATHALFVAADGYQTAVRLEWVLNPETLLAYQMNGKALAPEHGYPLRLLVAGVYGQKMPKWITHIRFIDYPFQSLWEKLGWSETAEVQTHAIIQSPTDRAQVNGQVTIQGVAFAGLREIEGVDVRIDGGEWIPTNLVKGSSSLTWTRWSLTWTPYMAGMYTIEARATDSSGFTQSQSMTGKLNDARPNGSSYIHRVSIEVI